MFHRVKQLTLLFGDILALYIALFFSVCARYFSFRTDAWNALIYPMSKLFVVAAIIFFIVGLFDLAQSKNRFSFFKKIFLALGIWLVIGVIYFYLSNTADVTPKTIMLLCALFGTGTVSGWRYVHNRYLSKTILKSGVVFVGLPAEAREIIEKIGREPELGYEISGLIAGAGDLAQETLPGLSQHPTALSLSELKLKTTKPINVIIVAPSMSQNAEITAELYRELLGGASVVSLEKFYEDILKRIPPFTFSESWFLANMEDQNKKIYDRFRLLIDIVFGSMMVVVFAISFPIVAPLIKITSAGPIFYSHFRIGRNGTRFRIYKYRSMKALSADGGAEINGVQYASENDNRITPFGKFLRKTRIDELPQFINIFKNEMSIVGPRPERPEFVDQLSAQMPFYKLRHMIKPGLTGWAQIQNSYYGTIEENLRKLEYDLYYLKNRSAVLDATIILRTFNILGRMAGR